ncbi:MAG: extracellular solute-binding protein [Chloroflexota bacterium]
MLNQILGLILMSWIVLVLTIACNGIQNAFGSGTSDPSSTSTSTNTSSGPAGSDCQTRMLSLNPSTDRGTVAQYIRSFWQTPPQTSTVVIYTAMNSSTYNTFLNTSPANNTSITTKGFTETMTVSLQDNATDIQAIVFKICNLSTGPLTIQILSEQGNPHVDVIWGLNVTSMMRIQATGMLDIVNTMTTTITTDDRILVDQAHSSDEVSWVGQNVFMTAFCVNQRKLQAVNARFKKLRDLNQSDVPVDIPQIDSWQSLLHPNLRNRILMGNVSKSGTAFVAVSGLMQNSNAISPALTSGISSTTTLEGQDLAWAYLDQLNTNIATYPDSTSNVCKRVVSKKAEDEDFIIGISSASRIASLIEEKLNTEQEEEKIKPGDVYIVLPKEGSGWGLDGIALVRKPTASKVDQQVRDTFFHWAVQNDTISYYNLEYPITTKSNNTPDISQLGFLPENEGTNLTRKMLRDNMIPYNFRWAGANRDRIVAEWLNRYESKTDSGSQATASQ